MEMIRITLIFFIAAAVLVVLAAALTGCQSEPPRWKGYQFDRHWRTYRVS